MFYIGLTHIQKNKRKNDVQFNVKVSLNIKIEHHQNITQNKFLKV